MKKSLRVAEVDEKLRPWEEVLQWLPPADLAAVAATCRHIRRLSAAVTARRAADASRGYEARPVPFFSLSSPPYSSFLYSPSSLIGGSIPPDPFSRPWPDRPLLGRPTDAVALEIRRTQLKGWGLFAGEPIQKGEFVCEYAGEYLTTAEARRREREYDKRGGAALLVVREHLPSGKACLRVNVDATAVGNAARFINHECGGGNLAAEVVRETGFLLPRVCFFAERDVAAGEELTFSYGEAAEQGTGRPCFCGSDSCSGFLPREET